MRSQTPPLRVLLVDDHAWVRSAIASVLEAPGGIGVIGEAGTVADAVAQTLRLRPDLVLMDLRLPDGSGIDACRQIRSLAPDVQIVMLTLYDEPGARRASLAAGAAAFLVKDGNAMNLSQSVTEAAPIEPKGCGGRSAAP